MFLKAKSIILKAFPTCGSNFSLITFRLHFFAYFCNRENLKHKPKIAKAQQRQVKKRQKFWQDFGKSGKYKKVAMVLTEVGLKPKQTKLFCDKCSITFAMKLPASLHLVS